MHTFLFWGTVSIVKSEYTEIPGHWENFTDVTEFFKLFSIILFRTLDCKLYKMSALVKSFHFLDLFVTKIETLRNKRNILSSAFLCILLHSFHFNSLIHNHFLKARIRCWGLRFLPPRYSVSHFPLHLQDREGKWIPFLFPFLPLPLTPPTTTTSLLISPLPPFSLSLFLSPLLPSLPPPLSPPHAFIPSSKDD